MDIDDNPRNHDLYARWVDGLVRIAFAVSTVTFALYAFGVLAPHVELAALPELWRLPLAQYLERSGSPTGWQWIALVRRGDYLNLAAIALFGLIVLVSYLRIIPVLPRLQAALAAAQVLVLLAAMSGVF
ncbi:MAG: hypothetical protein ACREU1_01060 [Burkholderiales bacterium]